MKQETPLKHEFVEFIPEELKEGTLYVSIRFATVLHLCACGCKNKVVTPLRPTDWKLIFDGKTISLDPSIGNWSFECQSHYWISCNTVRWSCRWSQEEIAAGRAHDRLAKDRYFDAAGMAPRAASLDAPDPSERVKAKPDLQQKLKNWWSRLRSYNQKG